MNFKEQLEKLKNERAALMAKIDNATDEELNNIERELRKNDLHTAEIRKQMEAAEKDNPEPDPSLRSDVTDTEQRSVAPLNGLIKSAPAERSDEEKDLAYRKAFMDFCLRKTPIPAELRADAVTATSDVSAVIPVNIINRILEERITYGEILSLVTKTNYAAGARIPVSNVRPVASWVEEGAGSDKQKKTAASYIEFGWYKLRCAIAMTLETTVVTLKIFEDTFVRQAMEAMEIAKETAIISGTGTGQPKGILAETAKAGQALTAAAPSYQLLIDAEAALPTAYENGAVWCMSKKTFMSFYGITDANGQPIARVNAGFAGRPERTLLGRTVVVSDKIDSWSESLTTGKKFAFLFDFRDYILNENMAMRAKYYEDNDTDDQIMKVIALCDGKVVDKGSLVTIAKAAAPVT